MASEDCLGEIRRRAGDLTDDQIDGLVSEFQRRQRLARAGRSADQALPGMSDGDEIARLADEMAEEFEMAALVEKRNAALNLRARIETVDYVRRNFGEDPALGIEARLTGVNRLREGARRSADAEQRQLAGYYTQGLVADVEKAGLWRLFVSGEIDQEITRAMWALGREEDIPAEGLSREARDLAKILHKWQEAARTDANRAGAWIRKMPGYVVRQSHDQFRIRGAGFEAWRDFILPRLDDRSFDGVDDVDGFLRNVYMALASGVHLTHAGGEASAGLKGFGSIARRMSQDRLLHFRGADDWFAYNARFGSGSLREALLGGLDRTARQTGLMRSWGPNAEMTYRAVIDDLMAEAPTPEARRKLRDQVKMLDNRFAEVDGSVNIPGHLMAARYSASIRALQSMAKLGGAVLSAFADIPIAASELRYQGVGFLDSYAQTLRGLVAGRGRGEQREILGMIGVAMEGMQGTVVQRFSGHDDLPGTMSRLLRTFFKFNGLTWWTDSLRAGVAFAMSRRLAGVAGSPWASLDADLQRSLRLFDVDAGKWDLLRRHAVQEAEGERFLVPEGAREIPDADLAGYLGRRSSPERIRRLREDLESALRSYFVDRAEYAVINPDARTNAILRRGLQPGTIEGEALRFVGQFKQFPVAVLQKTVGREIYGRGSDTLGKALRNGNGEMLGLAQLVLGTTAAGYVAMSAKDLVKGRTPRDPTDRATWLAAMAQGGGAGIYGDFLFGEARNRFGQGALETMLGPAFGTASDIVDLYGRARDGEDLAAQALSVAVNNTPFANLFYTRIALDYLVLYQLREMVSPGYLRRYERRLERDNAQRFLISPSSAIPTGGGGRPFEGVR